MSVNVIFKNFSSKLVVKVGAKDYVVDLITKEANTFINYEIMVNGELYCKDYTVDEVEEAIRNLNYKMECVANMIRISEQLNIPLIAGDYALTYVNEAMIDERTDVGKSNISDLIEIFLDCNAIRELPMESLNNGELVCYNGVQGTDAEETSFGLELVRRDDIEELNVFNEDDGDLESVEAYKVDQSIETVLMAFNEMIAEGAFNGINSVENRYNLKIAETPENERKIVVLENNMLDEEGREIFQAGIPYTVEIETGAIVNEDGIEVAVADIWVDFEVRYV